MPFTTIRIKLLYHTPACERPAAAPTSAFSAGSSPQPDWPPPRARPAPPADRSRRGVDIGEGGVVDTRGGGVVNTGGGDTGGERVWIPERECVWTPGAIPKGEGDG